jgi:5-methylcytosine-specific restriction endonuclease McrA
VDVLVLSSTLEPINQISWQRAFTLLALGHVEVYEEYTDWNVCTTKQAYRVPAVIRFLEGATGWKRGVRFSRENVYSRDRGQCQYCGNKVTKNEFTYDHVTPRAQGGKTRWENIVISCLPCNQKKGNRTPGQAGLHLRTKPVKPRSLPGSQRLALPNQIPTPWRPYLRDFGYWNGELESEA